MFLFLGPYFAEVIFLVKQFFNINKLKTKPANQNKEILILSKLFLECIIILSVSLISWDFKVFFLIKFQETQI